MALPSDYISGTITLTNGSTAFTGTGTGWLAADFREGDIILDVEGGEGAVAVITSITSNTAGVLSKEWEGPTLTGVAYRMRYQWDSGRVSAQSRAAIEMLGNGNLQSFAAGTGPGVVVMDGPHSVTIKPESDFVNGVAYDVQVDTLADRDAYDGQSEGFAVLVSDMGDGRSALYSKVSNTVGDWGAPAYITGPVGPLPDVEATVTSLPPGSTATVTPTPIPGGVRLDFDLPGASGFYNAGVYDIAEAYNQDDVVRHNGSSFIALQAVPVGESPSSAFPPVDTAYWQVLAAKGQDGTGTGDVVGPSGATDSSFVAFDGASGKLVKELSNTAATAKLDVLGGDSGAGGVKGLVPAPAAGDAAANKILSAGGGWVVPDPWQNIPIGAPVPVFDNLSGVIAPPTDKTYRYIKLSASDPYNSGVLTAETVSGSAPLIVATAQISLSGSPLNGVTINLINTERRSLRAGSAGTAQSDALQNVTGSIGNVVTDGGNATGPFAYSNIGSNNLTAGGGTRNYGNFTFNLSASARTDIETRGKNIGATYYMRIK